MRNEHPYSYTGANPSTGIRPTRRVSDLRRRAARQPPAGRTRRGSAPRAAVCTNDSLRVHTVCARWMPLTLTSQRERKRARRRLKMALCLAHAPPSAQCARLSRVH